MTKRFNPIRFAKRTLLAQAAIGLCVGATIVSTGCRSGRPSLSMFGMNREPSPEMLAGSGPTATYPTPPSASATPTAIASIAGGTATPSTNPGMRSPAGMQYGAPTGMANNALATNPYAPQQPMPTVNSTPGVPSTSPAANPYAQMASRPTGPTGSNPYALPGSNPPSRPVDYAAAAANGYAASGYQAGTKPTAPQSTPAPTSMPPIALPTAGQSLASSGTPTTNSSATAPAKPSAFSIPNLDSLGASAPKTANDSKPSGFSLPGGMVPGLGSQPTSSTTASNTSNGPATSPAVSAISLPSSMSDTLEGAKNQMVAAGQKVADATKATANGAAQAASKATSPAFQTATGMGSGGMGSGGSSTSISPAGYTPGSTGATTGYPGATMVR